MSGNYETTEEVMRALQQRRIAVDRDTCVKAMNELGFHFPLGDADLDDLLPNIGSNGRRTDSPEERVRKVLASKHWKDAVVKARWRLGLPAEGVSKGEAMSLFMPLTSGNSKRDVLGYLQEVLESEGKEPKACQVFVEFVRQGLELDSEEYERLTASQEFPEVKLLVRLRELLDWWMDYKDGKKQFWIKVYQEVRSLYPLLSLDTREIEQDIQSSMTGSFVHPTGMTPLLCLSEDDPKVEGLNNLKCLLMAHVLFNFAMRPSQLCPHAHVDLVFENLADGSLSVRAVPLDYNSASATELKQIMMQIGKINRTRRGALLPVYVDGNTWQEKWENWNKLFPELAFVSPDALRKYYTYEKQGNGEGQELVDFVAKARLMSESIEMHGHGSPQFNVLARLLNKI